MNLIKRIDSNNNEKIFNSIQEAAKSIDVNIENWKIELFIADAINNNKRAFKYIWKEIKNS